MEKDFNDAYTLFANKYNDPRIITINDFLTFWAGSQLGFLVYVTLNKKRSAVKMKMKISISKRSGRS